MSITIVTDSTCDLTQDIIKDNDLKVLPLFVNFNEESYLDGIDIKIDQLFEKIDKENVMPKTAAIPPATYHQVFEEELNKGNDVIVIGLGSGFSLCYQNANLAASEFDTDKICIVDSKNLSSGTGLLVMKAIKYRSLGYDVHQIKEEVEKCVDLVRTQFAIDTLEYLHKGGRCSGTAKLFGTLLHIKPIIRVTDGKMIVAKKPRGKYNKALESILDYVRHDANNIDEDCMMITHTIAFSDANYLRTKLKDIDFHVDNLLETRAGCVIGSHCGPRTIGILYILKQPQD